jgi:tripartite-type tricarboxylate transporter receptor subunit TctC
MRPGLLKQYKDMLATMNSSPEWKATRKKYGWEPFYLTSDQASTFLVSQEEIISNLVRKVDQL